MNDVQAIDPEGNVRTVSAKVFKQYLSNEGWRLESDPTPPRAIAPKNGDNGALPPPPPFETVVSSSVPDVPQEVELFGDDLAKQIREDFSPLTREERDDQDDQ